MYKICSMLIGICFMQSILPADEQRHALFDSLRNKDIAETELLLNAGAQPEAGMLLDCKTRAQAELLIAYGASIEAANKAYGFLPERMKHDAEPALFEFFLQHTPLTVLNRYGRGSYHALLLGLTRQDQASFDAKLKLLSDHGCFCEPSDLMFAIEEGLSDKALGNDREGVKRKFEILFAKNNLAKKGSIVHLLHKREHKGSSSNLKMPGHAYEIQKSEISQYEKQKEQEAAEKGLNDIDTLLHVLFSE